MKVTLIGGTWFNRQAAEEATGFKAQDDSPDALALIEFAGRNCYRSFHRPDPATRRNASYIRKLVKKTHESVLEHATATFLLQGVSRSLTHELVRHRHLSPSQQSQRYVDESDSKMIIPTIIEDDPQCQAEFYYATDIAKSAYIRIYERLTALGHGRKEARGAARSTLPNANETTIVVTGNYHAWRDFLRKRLDPGAEAEIRALAYTILAELLQLAQPVFEDIAIEAGHYG